MTSPAVGICPESILKPPPRNRLDRLRSPWFLWPVCCALLLGVTYAFARGIEAFRANPAHASRLSAIGAALLNIGSKEVAETAAVVLCLAAAWLFPRMQWRWLVRAEQAIARFAVHRTQAVVLAGLFPMIIRLGLLPVLRMPQPLVADEFGYLLLADTFASGRLTNPTHPMWRHFETIYVFHQPTYTSIYPLAPAVFLTIPKLLGANPWFGVWLGAGLMAALICWMLQAWMPPKWALIGGLLAACRFAIVGPWMNSYWGGATAAIGGALVLGALPRIMKRRRVRDSLLFGLGFAILSQSRPYEGMLLGVPLLIVLGVWLLRARAVSLRCRVTHVALPLATVLIALVAGTAYYNWRVTGSPLLMPYGLHQKIYGTPQRFFGQAPIRDASGLHGYKDIADVFRWQLKAHDDGFSWHSEGKRLQSFWRFYLQPLWTFPLLFLPLLLRDRKTRLLLLLVVLMLAGNSVYPFFFAHYAAPLCGLMVLFVVQGLRHLRALRIGFRPLGVPAFRMVLLLIGVSALATALGGLLQPWQVTAAATPRSLALDQLRQLGGAHLVMVRYSPFHSFHYGVVFNDADIDRSPVVWARELDPASNRALVNYFGARDIWWFNPDQEPVTLVPYADKPYLSAVADGAGKRDDPREGISPGGIAVLLGGNFVRDANGTVIPSPLGSLPVRLAGSSSEYGAIFAPAPIDAKPAAGRPFPLTAGNVSVRFGNIPAPILGISIFDGQDAVMVQAPVDLPLGQTSVTMRVNGRTVVKKAQVLPATPGIFQMRMSDGRLRGIVLRLDNSVVDLEHPAHPGDRLKMFATGLGPLVPPVRTNEPGITPAVSEPDHRLIIGVNHHGAPLISARYAPSMVGVEEIVFEIPADVPPGSDIPLSVGVVVDGKPVYSNKSSLPVR